MRSEHGVRSWGWKREMVATPQSSPSWYPIIYTAGFLWSCWLFTFQVVSERRFKASPSIILKASRTFAATGEPQSSSYISPVELMEMLRKIYCIQENLIVEIIPLIFALYRTCYALLFYCILKDICTNKTRFRTYELCPLPTGLA